MIHNFYVKTKAVDNGPGYWKYTLVEVYDGDTKIGEYQRNYGSFGEETFYRSKKSMKIIDTSQGTTSFED